MRFASLLCCLFFAFGLFAQSTRAISSDSLNVEATADSSILITKRELRKPGNALRWAIIPGGGQIYNKAWWKLPLVYGGLFGAISIADYNQTNYNRIITALEAKCYGVDDPDNCVETPHEFTGTQLDDINALRSRRDRFDKAKQTAYILIFVAYLLQGVEAFTDAHLKTFDVEDDLSLFKIGPMQQPGELMSYGLTVPLGSGRKQKLQKIELRKQIGR